MFYRKGYLFPVYISLKDRTLSHHLAYEFLIRQRNVFLWVNTSVQQVLSQLKAMPGECRYTVKTRSKDLVFKNLSGWNLLVRPPKIWKRYLFSKMDKKKILYIWADQISQHSEFYHWRHATYWYADFIYGTDKLNTTYSLSCNVFVFFRK